LVEFNLKVKK